jgi:hypothetical protein
MFYHQLYPNSQDFLQVTNKQYRQLIFAKIVLNSDYMKTVNMLCYLRILSKVQQSKATISKSEILTTETPLYFQPFPNQSIFVTEYLLNTGKLQILGLPIHVF